MGSWYDKMRLHTERNQGVLLLSVFPLSLSLPPEFHDERTKSIGSCKNARRGRTVACREGISVRANSNSLNPSNSIPEEREKRDCRPASLNCATRCRRALSSDPTSLAALTRPFRSFCSCIAVSVFRLRELLTNLLYLCQTKNGATAAYDKWSGFCVCFLSRCWTGMTSTDQILDLMIEVKAYVQKKKKKAHEEQDVPSFRFHTTERKKKAGRGIKKKHETIKLRMSRRCLMKGWFFQMLSRAALPGLAVVFSSSYSLLCGFRGESLNGACCTAPDGILIAGHPEETKLLGQRPRTTARRPTTTFTSDGDAGVPQDNPGTCFPGPNAYRWPTGVTISPMKIKVPATPPPNFFAIPKYLPLRPTAVFCRK